MTLASKQIIMMGSMKFNKKKKEKETILFDRRIDTRI